MPTGFPNANRIDPTPAANTIATTFISLIIYLILKDKHFFVHVLAFSKKSFRKVYQYKRAGKRDNRPYCFERYESVFPDRHLTPQVRTRFVLG